MAMIAHQKGYVCCGMVVLTEGDGEKEASGVL